jgi:arabinan endo-1,5-alpha-L-arabinosidase
MPMKIFALISCYLLFISGFVFSQPLQANRILENNGLKGNLMVHDPSAIRQGNTYYIFSTGKGVSVKTSTDRINWKNAGRIFDSVNLPSWYKTDIPNQDGSLWAPDIHYSNGKYHLYYSVSAWMNFNSSIGYASNTTLDRNDPNYKWVDEGQVISYKNGGEKVNVIDPNGGTE